VVEPVVVAPQWRPYVQQTDEGRAAAARERLEHLAQQTCSRECEAIVSLGRPDDQIASIAEERKAGVIVMGLGGGLGLLERRPGTIAYRVLCIATSPVLVVPAEATLPT
jgi:nucleotide-binding universal stress UspA family protein